MKKILITGATGNIGVEVLKSLYPRHDEFSIYAGVRNIEKAKKQFSSYPNLNYVQFDFENTDSFSAFVGMDCIFLLRPPHISNIPKFFAPIIDALKKYMVKEIVFLSVQGADKSSIIPHYKIEKLILGSGIDYIFLRPSYFMQNLTTTLYPDIKSKRMIYLPSGDAKFNWVDVEDIGEVAAKVMIDFDQYKNNGYDVTGNEILSFPEVVDIINTKVATPIRYQSVNIFRFYWMKKKAGVNRGLIIVMLLLHILPRFEKPSKISDFYFRLTGKQPKTIAMFAEREKALLS